MNAPGSFNFLSAVSRDGNPTSFLTSTGRRHSCQSPPTRSKSMPYRRTISFNPSTFHFPFYIYFSGDMEIGRKMAILWSEEKNGDQRSCGLHFYGRFSRGEFGVSLGILVT